MAHRRTTPLADGPGPTALDADGPTRRRRLATAAAALLAGLGLVALTAGCASDADGARSLHAVVREQPIDATSVQLTDARDGAPIDLAPADGELTLVYFGYTHCPDVCPTTLSDVRTALEQIDAADQVELVFVTADPQRDTAEVLDGYVGSFVDDYQVVRFEDPAELRAVEDVFGASSSVGEPDADGTYDVSHSGWLYAIVPDGHVAAEWPFPTPAEDLADDMSALLSDPPTTTT